MTRMCISERIGTSEKGYNTCVQRLRGEVNVLSVCWLIRVRAFVSRDSLRLCVYDIWDVSVNSRD